MRLFIIGANGKTGTQLIDLALRRGHSIRAFVRSPHKIVRRDPRLEVVRGDPHRTDELAPALPGSDVVISALGVRPRELLHPITLLQECAASTVAAMTRAGVRRLLVVSAATLFPGKGLRLAFFRRILAHQIRDLVVTEDIVRATPLDWTIARPPRLTRSTRETYRSEPGALPAGGFSISFRALAAFLLDAAEQRIHLGEVVGLAR
jgi:putative NADH-flavin reductase